MNIQHWLFLILLFSSSNTLSQQQESIASQTDSPDAQNDANVILTFGPSPYGFFALEYKKGRHGFGLGVPESLYYRHYRKSFDDSFFYGVYAGLADQSYDREKDYDGITFKNDKHKWAGLGVGYLWQWPSGWNVTASVSVHYMDEDFVNSERPKRNETSVFVFPGFDVGYKF